MKTPNMEKSKEESVILLSMDKPTENNNTVENGDLHPFEYEKKLEQKNGELQTFDIEKTMMEGAKIKSKSRVPLVLAWTCVGCAIAFATIALVVFLTRDTGPLAPPVPHNQTTTISSSTISTTPSHRTSIKPTPTSIASTVSRTLATLQPSSSSTISPSVSVTPSLTSVSVSPTLSVTISSSATSTGTLSDSPTIPVISTSPVMKSTSVLVSPTKSTVIPTSLSKNSVTSATVTVEITTMTPGCSDDEFQCSSGQCIPKNLTCDGEAQCYDLSDETNCSNCQGFECNSGLCLWTYSFRCNDKIDCPDLSDEIGCPWRRGFEECDNGLYVHSNSWCDGIDDCFDNSDERDCEGECHLLGEKLCPDAKTCVLHEWWCDGHYDCPGGGDEANCGACSSDQWQCSDYSCISKGAVCNGVIDCPSQDDEADCLGFKDSGNPHQTSGLVLVHPQGQQLPVCSSDWSHDLSDIVCQYLGFESSNGYSAVSDSGRQAYMVVDTSRHSNRLSQNETALALLRKSSACSTNKVLSVSCVPKVCGERKVSYLTPFIVGGTLSPPGKWPWVVSISYLGKDTCGGVLVADNWVLTAAHCIVSGSYNYTTLPYNFEVTAGTVYRRRSEDNVNDGHRQMVKVKKIIVHPKTVKLVTGVMDWDMALLQLSKPIIYGDYVQPVCLPSQDESFPTKSQCYLAGWGFINPQQETVNELREAKMRLWGDADCETNTVNGETHVNINSTVCAGYTNGIISACQGDSGGPLMCSDTRGRWTVAGVMSSGSEGCDGGQFNQANRFARVSSASDWLYSVIQPS